MTKFAPPAPRTIGAQWHGGRQTPTLIVMHSTVGPTKAGAARGVANYFAREDNKTSAHYVVDAAEEYQCVPDHVVAYHCGHNEGSLAVEMCDYPVQDSAARWFLPKAKRTGKRSVTPHGKINPLRWLEPYHRAMLRRAGQLVGDLCLAYDIPARYLTDAQLRAWDAAGRPAHLGGLATHAQMSRVFHQSTHWDPGAWPRALFLHRVRVRIANRTKKGN